MVGSSSLAETVLQMDRQLLTYSCARLDLQAGVTPDRLTAYKVTSSRDKETGHCLNDEVVHELGHRSLSDSGCPRWAVWAR